jgi:hypothetical protein
LAIRLVVGKQDGKLLIEKINPVKKIGIRPLLRYFTTGIISFYAEKIK